MQKPQPKKYDLYDVYDLESYMVSLGKEHEHWEEFHDTFASLYEIKNNTPEFVRLNEMFEWRADTNTRWKDFITEFKKEFGYTEKDIVLFNLSW